MKTSLTRSSSFTHDGKLFSLLSVDGRLRIWDVVTGKLLQEFSSASTIESSCTCLAWTRDSKVKEKRKKEPKQKKRKVVDDNNESLFAFAYPLLVVGTNNGTVFSYDPVAGEISTIFKEKHLNRVNCFSYNDQEDVIYSCSNDRHIIGWSHDSGEIKIKWKGDKLPVQMVCVGPCGKTMLSAGFTIKLWNLGNQELLMKFNGHSSPVSLLKFSSFQTSLAKPVVESDGYYFLSGSTEERVVNAWHINLSNSEKQAIASYRLSDVPLFLDSMLLEKNDQPLNLCVGCADGRVHFYANALNGRSKRPIEAKKTLDLFQKEGKDSNIMPTPLINGLLSNMSDLTLKLASGRSLNPSFKEYVISKLEINGKIVEEVSKNILFQIRGDNVEKSVQYPLQNSSLKVIGSTDTMETLKGINKSVVIDVNGNEEDRQKTDLDRDIISMEERLKSGTPASKRNEVNNILPHEIEKYNRGFYFKLHKTFIACFTKQDFAWGLRSKHAVPNAGSFSQLLIQALHSRDENMLNDILFKTYSEQVLKKTIQRLPINLVGHLMTVLIDKLQQNPARSTDLSSWLRLMMTVHLSQMTTNEALSPSLATLYQLLKMQQEVQPLLLSIQGKIDLLFSQVSDANSSDEEDINDPAIVYNDDSDEETEELVSSDKTKSDGDSQEKSKDDMTSENGETGDMTSENGEAGDTTSDDDEVDDSESSSD